MSDIVVTGELEPIEPTELERLQAELAQKKYRLNIPEEHCVSIDTKLRWLWNQRFGTVQTICMESTDLLDNTACTLILQAIMGRDLESISMLFNRLEGGALSDEQLADSDSTLRF